MIRRLVTTLVLIACTAGAGMALADTAVTVEPTKINLAFMNVFELPENGGAYVFGSPWGFGDLTAVYSGSDLTLGPNTIGDPDPFWYQGGGGPGAPGNKIMEANSYAEETGTFHNQTVSFSGIVKANTLTTAHTAIAFVKDFAPDYSSFTSSTIVLPASGYFKVSLVTIDDPARHVQYGFQMTGPDVWITDVAPFGSVTISPDVATEAAPTSWGRIKTLYR